MADYTSTGIIHNTSVDFTRRVISEPVHVVQGDKTTPQISVELLADGQPYTVPDGAQVNIALDKKDGTFVLNKADSVEGNIATFTVTAQMAAVFGEFTPEVQVIEGSGQSTTGKFPLIVDKAEVQEGMVESSSEGTALIAYVSRAEEAAEKAEKVQSQIDSVTVNTEAAAKSAKEAAESAIVSATNADLAKASATAAKTSETAAKAHLESVQEEHSDITSEISAANTAIRASVTEAKDYSIVSRSYAEGGTGTRDGEDTANARYYMEQAQKAALGNLDDKMSDTSENAVQNKVIKAYVDGHTPTGYEDLVNKINSIYRETSSGFASIGTSEGSALAHTIYGMSVQDGIPTPSVPVDIVSAKADFKCVGKNLIPYPYYRQSGYSSQGMTSTYGDDGVITINKEVGSTTAFFTLYFGNNVLIPNTRYKLSMSLENTNSASVYISLNGRDIAAIRKKASGNYDYTFTTANSLGLMNMGLYFAPGDVESNCKVKVMLTLANADQTYEPYQHKDVTTDLTLRAIEVASTDDYTYERDGKYYIADTVDWSEDRGYEITRRIKEIIYNGTEAWNTNALSGNRRAFFRNLSDNVSPKTQDDVIYAICNHFSATSRNNSVTNAVTNVFAQNSSNLDILFISADTSITTVAQWKTWLESNNVILDYILATPTTEPITSEQARALLSLKTYDEATSISATGDIEPSLDLEYSKDRNTALALTGHNLGFKNALKLNDINAALIELGGTV